MTESNGMIRKINNKTSKFLRGYICQSLDEMVHKDSFNKKILDGVFEKVKSPNGGKTFIDDLIEASSKDFIEHFNPKNFTDDIANAMLDAYQKKMPDIVSAYKQMKPVAVAVAVPAEPIQIAEAVPAQPIKLAKGGKKSRYVHTKKSRKKYTMKHRHPSANVSPPNPRRFESTAGVLPH